MSSSFTPTAPGSKVVSPSYLTAWAECRTLWFNRYLRPMDGGQGIVPITTAAPLLIGGGFHAAQETYYRSGAKDGNYDVELALDAARAYFASRRDEFEDADEYQAGLDRVLFMQRSYHDRYGPRGVAAEYPAFQVLLDDAGEPIIEREYEVQLGDGFGIRTRFDAIVRYHGYVYVRELKTTGGGVGTVFSQYQLHSQSAIELLVAKMCLPFEVHGVLIDVVRSVPTKGANTAAFGRQCISRSDGDLEKVRQDVLNYLHTIDWYVNRVNVNGGLASLASLDFSMDGQFNGRCHAFGRACEYARLCLNVETAGGNLLGYRPRTKLVDTPTNKE